MNFNRNTSRIHSGNLSMHFVFLHRFHICTLENNKGVIDTVTSEDGTSAASVHL